MSASESAFSDAEDDPVLVVGATERKRLRSVDEMVKSLEGKKKRVVSPKQSEKVRKEDRASFMDEIRMMIDASIKGATETLWERINGKMSSLEVKIDKLEGQIFERDKLIDELQETLRGCEEHITRLEDQVEDLERHSRSRNLIFSSGQFGKRTEGENIAEKTVTLINECFPSRNVTDKDFSAIHRIGNENSVICAFVNKNLRNELYAERLSLRRREVDAKGRVYINESLTNSKREIFNRLLGLKKENRIWTVFTKNGIPCCKLSKDSQPISVSTFQQLESLVQRSSAAAPGGGAGTAGRGPPPRAPPPRAPLRSGGRPWAGPPPPAVGRPAGPHGGPPRSGSPAAPAPLHAGVAPVNPRPAPEPSASAGSRAADGPEAAGPARS